eukprot:scpid97602/ scgid8929/ 
MAWCCFIHEVTFHDRRDICYRCRWFKSGSVVQIKEPCSCRVYAYGTRLASSSARVAGGIVTVIPAVPSRHADSSFIGPLAVSSAAVVVPAEHGGLGSVILLDVGHVIRVAYSVTAFASASP